MYVCMYGCMNECMNEYLIASQVERAPYEGPVMQLNNQGLVQALEGHIIPSNQEFHTRGPTRCGGLNLHDSSFHVSGQLVASTNTQNSHIT